MFHKYFVFSVLFVFSNVVLLESFPNGAPLSACGNMLPDHNGNVPQTSGDFIIWPYKNVCFNMNQPFEIGFKSVYFAGAFMQVRSDIDDSIAQGSFTLSSSTEQSFHTLDCFGVPASAVTHNSNATTPSLLANFTVNVYSGPLHLSVTLVRKFAIFWVGLNFSIPYCGGPLGPPGPPTSQPPSNTIMPPMTVANSQPNPNPPTFMIMDKITTGVASTSITTTKPGSGKEGLSYDHTLSLLSIFISMIFTFICII